ncbi:MAG TPA: LysE family translocator [Leucothrix sp.]|nr:LysE family translocator [Leucothrix sp.]
MIPIETLLLFFVTTFVVVLSPGPAVIAVTTESASNGFKRSLWVILGIAVANALFFILSAMGIVTLILASDVMFTIIKWAGVAYLLYLGLSAIFGRSGTLNINSENKNKTSSYKIFLKGFILEISNPKALLYFSALLPQFIDISRSIAPQVATLGAITFMLDFVCYSSYAYLGWKSSNAGLKPFVVNIINKTAGSMLIFAGLKMATVER